MDKHSNALNWFDIPVTNMERAKKFYETLFDIEMFVMEMGGNPMAFFPCGDDKVGGSLILDKELKPGKDGCLVYLNANPSIQKVIDKIEAAGGKVVVSKTQVSPEIGFVSYFIDCEGNRVGLHANN